MNVAKKPEILILAVVVVILIAGVVYNYRQISHQDKKIDEVGVYTSSAIRNLEKYTRTSDYMIEEIKNLKSRLDELEEIESKHQELTDAFEDLIEDLREKGFEVEIELPNHSKKKKKNRKAKRGKKETKKSKKKHRSKDSSDEDSSSSSEEENSNEAIERISRIQERRRSRGKR